MLEALWWGFLAAIGISVGYLIEGYAGAVFMGTIVIFNGLTLIIDNKVTQSKPVNEVRRVGEIDIKINRR